jgi:hypothetical protein
MEDRVRQVQETIRELANQTRRTRDVL